MNILQLLKADLIDERNKWARGYRDMRKTDPAKARELYRRLRRAVTATERALQHNLWKATG